MTAREGLRRWYSVYCTPSGLGLFPTNEPPKGARVQYIGDVPVPAEWQTAISAPAPDEVVLRVRWEWETDGDEDHNLVLHLGAIRFGFIWVAPNGNIRALRNGQTSKSSFYPTLAAAQAALIECAKGGEGE